MQLSTTEEPASARLILAGSSASTSITEILEGPTCLASSPAKSILLSAIATSEK